MYYSHFEAIKVTVFSVGMKRAQNSLIPHLDKLDDPLFELLRQCGISWHHHYKLDNFPLILSAVKIIERWTVLVIEISRLLRVGPFSHWTKGLIVL